MNHADLPKLQPYIRHTCTYLSPLGMLTIAEDEKGIALIAYTDETREQKPDQDSQFLTEAIRQLDEYFEGKRKQFELPLSLHGTDFQRRVWKALQEIPYGMTASYEQIAEAAGNRKACRAAGMANHRNPAVIVVPCHRIIAKDGRIGGYGGGIERKKYLLKLEGIRWKE